MSLCGRNCPLKYTSDEMVPFTLYCVRISAFAKCEILQNISQSTRYDGILEQLVS